MQRTADAMQAISQRGQRSGKPWAADLERQAKVLEMHLRSPKATREQAQDAYDKAELWLRRHKDEVTPYAHEIRLPQRND